MFGIVTQMLYGPYPPQPEVGAVNTINTWADSKNPIWENPNTSVPPVPRVNAINEWADTRNAEGLSPNSNQNTY